MDGQLLWPQLPPLGRDWEPILGVGTFPVGTFPDGASGDEGGDDWTGCAIWVLCADMQEAWCAAQQLFSQGALAIISPFAIPPQDGCVTIQSSLLATSKGIMSWCRTQLQGVFGIVVTGPGNEPTERSKNILHANDPVACAGHWLGVDIESDVVVELDWEKKDQVLYQSVLPQCDFLGIYSLAVGAQHVQQLVNEIVLFASVGNASWLDRSSILLAPECWAGPLADHDEWSRVVLKSPGENYAVWLSDHQSKQHIAEISSSD